MTLNNESDAHKQLELTRNFLELSRNADTCAALRSSDCIQLLVQILHANDDGAGGGAGGGAARKNASQALHNIVQGNQREVKVLRLLDQIHDYSCNFLRTQLQSGGESIADDEERHPLAAMKLLMKASFDEEHRQTMCELGALKAIPNLVHLDHAVHGPASGREQCNLLRRYALMTLTNLTCGDENNKSLLCGQKQFMEALVAQLDSNSSDLDDLLQATASVLRNLSWRADKHLKTIFNELGTVRSLALASMQNKCENTLKAILSALWNLSAHCSTNKAEFCAVDGALAFLVQMLSYEGPSKTLKIVENAGGILRNVSSHIAVCESYRQILRQHNCLAILLQQLKSDNLTVVSNSCGTLWNLSARCPEDQQFLIDHNAIPLLRALISSKNSMIAEGSASALKNLVNYRGALELAPPAPREELVNGHAGTLPRRYSSMRLSSNPTGSLKKVRPPTNGNSLPPRKCESRESIYSGKSDTDSTKFSSKSENGYEPRTLSTATAKAHYDAPTEEQPIDYSMKYSYSEHKPSKPNFDNSIDLDQPTDFSVRYKERRSAQAAQATQSAAVAAENGDSSEILLILDETGTGSSSPAAQPLVKSASACDLSSDQVQRPKTLNLRSTALENLATADKSDDCLDTPEPEPGERPINYCEEGTPGCFSRFDSLNSLTDVAPGKQEKQTVVPKTPDQALTPTADPIPAANNASNNNINGASQLTTYSAMQTPLMFSRHSSMDSLVNDETIACDDTASVISDYSRMQSGVISPSELPDSPTQSMPQSPQRDRKVHATQQQPQTPLRNSHDLNGNDDPRSYCTEDTPALLSKAGSNSNLSVLSIASTAAHDYNANESLPRALPRTLDPEMNITEDPITKMRCGGLPSYLPVTDEMNKYYVEDSPCNFSVISELSNLTVGSAQVGPMRVSMKPPQLLPRNAESAPKLPPRRSAIQAETEPRLLPKRSDSLSSLSMDSDDDCNLLSQAIAAGSCRPPPSGASTSSSQTAKTLPKPNGHRRQTIDGTKTDYSSDDSLDDGQSKSLFEQCILSGMHKSNDTLESERCEPPSDRFVSNQVRQIESMLATVRPPAARSTSASRQRQQQPHHHWV